MPHQSAASKSMRIMFWNHLFAPSIGGVEIFTMRLGRCLVRIGHQVSVVTTRFAPELASQEMIDGMAVHRLDFGAALSPPAQQDDSKDPSRNLFDLVTDVARLKRQLRPDIVHVNFADASPLFHLRTLRAVPSRTTVTFQAPLNDSFKAGQGLLGTLMRRSDALVAVSRAAAANAARFTGLGVEQLEVISPGVAPEPFLRPASPGLGPPTLLFVGRLVPEKGADLILEAVAHLWGEFDFRLRFVGDGPERPRLAALAQELGIQAMVDFAGPLGGEGVADEMTHAFCLVVPSRFEEPFGMVAVEGSLAGLPVIAADRGGLPEIVEHEETGLVFPSGDVAALTGALRRLLQDPHRAAQFGAAGRTRALARFTLDATAEQYEALFNRVLKQTPAGTQMR